MWNEKDVRLLYGVARVEWRKEEEEARRQYEEKRRELRELDLRIGAYKNKLENGIDPDSPEWSAALSKLRELERKREKYLVPDGGGSQFLGPELMPAWSKYHKAHARNISGSYPGDAEKYFQEWLEENGYFD